MGKYSKKRNHSGIIVFVLPVIVLALVIAWFITEDFRNYRKGEAFLESGDYAAAAEIFEALFDYKDASSRLLEARYALNCEWMDNEQFLDAAQGFADLGDYRDSIEKMGKCYYSLATAERLAKNYEQACTYFSLARDYRDSATQAQRMIYSLGHEAFLREDYETANKWFDQLEGSQSDYGAPHFLTMEDAADYLDQQLEDLSSQVRFHLGEVPDEDFYGKLRNMLPFHSAAPSYFDDDKLITVMVTEYYTADRILDAWEKQDTSVLNEEELKVLELALDLVAQADAETDNDIALEKWLHDWLCKQVVYESPDMDVKIRDYIQLRELNCIGAMLDGKANCQGYTDAFYLLGNLAGFEVRRLSGDTGEGHIWNMILLDEQWYIVDCTFDDLSDVNYDGWTYTYFNTALDPDVYEIYGGAEVLPDLAQEFSLKHSYFGQTNSCFGDVADTADYLVAQRSEQGIGWYYAMIEDSDVNAKKFEEALRKSLRKANITNVSWGELVEYYNGNTYISVFWE